MSHWTTIKTQLRELPALAAACAELRCQLVTPQSLQAITNQTERESATGQCFGHPGKVMARGWAGNTIPCDAMIKIPGCRYDVALTRQTDGSYSLAADFYSGEVSKALGTDFAKLKQLYGVHNTMQQARRLGHAVQRVAGQGGRINVVITGRL